MKPDPCADCGLCCMHMRTPPFTGLAGGGLETWFDSPRFRWLDRNAPAETPCMWLDLETGRCKHYDSRPGICSAYEVGGEACLAVRALVGLGAP